MHHLIDSLLRNACQCECHSRREGRSVDDDWNAHCCWHILRWVWLHCWMEICKIWFRNSVALLEFLTSCLLLDLVWDFNFDYRNQEAAHEKSQQYKEGKFILERYSITICGGKVILSLVLLLLLFWGGLREILWLSRFKVLGPDGSTYVNQDIQAGGSDVEDAWWAIQFGKFDYFSLIVHPLIKHLPSCGTC